LWRRGAGVQFTGMAERGRDLLSSRAQGKSSFPTQTKRKPVSPAPAIFIDAQQYSIWVVVPEPVFQSADAASLCDEISPQHAKGDVPCPRQRCLAAARFSAKNAPLRLFLVHRQVRPDGPDRSGDPVALALG